MVGDLLFYTGTAWQDKLIQWWTKSPINHVAIDAGDGKKIEALGSGIVETPYTTPYRTWSYDEHAKDADPVDMATALTWLESMVGKKYGWSDIASAANLESKFAYVVAPGHYDCSALATQFLIKAGGVDLGKFGLDPHLATPASLAKQLGVQ